MSILEEPGPLSRTARERLAERRIGQLAEQLAVQVVEPLADVLAAKYAQGLVQPVAGRPGYQDLLRPEPPPPGSSYRYAVPGEVVAFPLSAMCRLTTDANPGDRTLTLEYEDAEQVRYLVAGAPVTLAALQSQAFCWHPAAGDVTWPVGDAAIAPLPQQMIYPTNSLVLRLGNAGPGDQIDLVRLSVHLFPTD